MIATSTVPVLPHQAEWGPAHRDPGMLAGESESTSLTAARVGRVALNLLRLALGFEFLWAFLSGVAAGPLQGLFHTIAGALVINWLFMVGLLCIGTALILGVALRIAAASGAVLLILMWLASWPLATTAAGQPTGSTNPVVGENIIAALAIIVVGAFAAHSSGYLGRWWSHQPLVRRSPWLR